MSAPDELSLMLALAAVALLSVLICWFWIVFLIERVRGKSALSPSYILWFFSDVQTI